MKTISSMNYHKVNTFITTTQVKKQNIICIPQIPLCPFSISISPLLLKDNQYSDFYHYKLVVSVFELYMSGITMVSSFSILKRTLYIIHIYADMKFLYMFFDACTHIYTFSPRSGITGSKVWICSVLVDKIEQLSKLPAPVYIPTSNTRVPIAPHPPMAFLLQAFWWIFGFHFQFSEK